VDELIEKVKEILVSIPQWCDCCPAQRHRHPALNARVSIPQWCDCCKQTLPDITHTTCSFNPTMVRLLPVPADGDSVTIAAFQSHHGAIAASLPH